MRKKLTLRKKKKTKHRQTNDDDDVQSPIQSSSGAERMSRWTSWAPVPNKPTLSVDLKQHFNNNNNNNSLRRGYNKNTVGPFEKRRIKETSSKNKRSQDLKKSRPFC